MVKYIFLFVFALFTNIGIMAQSPQSPKRTVLDFTPKVPQEVINLALERVKQKEVACFNNGAIQKKKYKIINYTTSVAVDMKYNVWVEVVDPCNFGFNIKKLRRDSTFAQKILFILVNIN